MSPVYHYRVGSEPKLINILPGVATPTLPPGTGTVIDTPAPDPRPEGANYVKYETLYVSGDTQNDTLRRLTDPKIVTYPEGEFVVNDFTLNDAGFSPPAQCMGIVGSGKGTLGGSTGTVFKMAANSSTGVARGKVPEQGTKIPVQLNIFKFTNAAYPVTFKNFQIFGPAQGHPYHNFQCYATPDGSVFEDLLFTGGDGRAGTPPGETFMIQISGGKNQLIRRLEADGRRTPGADSEVFGGVGATFQNTAYSTLDNINVHHLRCAATVFYQTYFSDAIDCTFDSASGGQYVIGNGGINFERSNGCRLIRPKVWGLPNHVHVTHSNDYFVTPISGVNYPSEGGTLEVIDPTYTGGFNNNGYFYIESWLPYGSPTGTNTGNSMKYPDITGRRTDIQSAQGPSTAPWVHKADGTRIPYVYAFGGKNTIDPIPSYKLVP